MKVMFAVFSLLFMAQLAQANDINCGAVLLIVDKSSDLGVRGEQAEANIKLDKNDSANFAGHAQLPFLKGAYNLYVNFELGANHPGAETWSSLMATLVRTSKGKNKVLGAVSIPNTYYTENMITPVQVDLGNVEILDRVANLPGAFDGDYKFIKNLKNDDIVGASLQCSFVGSAQQK